jgi:hypothetical protein
MNPSRNILCSRVFYRFGAACCVYYIAAQLFQEISFRFILDDSSTEEAAILQRLVPVDQLRQVFILLSFSFIPILVAYAGVALARCRKRPGVSVSGFAFSVLFVGMEISIRSIDLFLVSRTWAVQYHSAGSEALKHAIAGRIQIWNESVGALYFGLIGVSLLSSVCFAIATWDRGNKWNQIVALGFVLTAVNSAGRIASGYLGQPWLEGPIHAVHFPVAFLGMGTLAAWLWRQSRAIGE